MFNFKLPGWVVDGIGGFHSDYKNDKLDLSSAKLSSLSWGWVDIESSLSWAGVIIELKLNLASICDFRDLKKWLWYN